MLIFKNLFFLLFLSYLDLMIIKGFSSRLCKAKSSYFKVTRKLDSWKINWWNWLQTMAIFRCKQYRLLEKIWCKTSDWGTSLSSWRWGNLYLIPSNCRSTSIWRSKLRKFIYVFIYFLYKIIIFFYRFMYRWQKADLEPTFLAKLWENLAKLVLLDFVFKKLKHHLQMRHFWALGQIQINELSIE